MADDKLQKLIKYQSDIKSRLETKEVPVKHKDREQSYRRFLANELSTVTSKVEALKMNAPVGKK